VGSALGTKTFAVPMLTGILYACNFMFVVVLRLLGLRKQADERGRNLR
jgi:hypothetical protein